MSGPRSSATISAASRSSLDPPSVFSMPPLKAMVGGRVTGRRCRGVASPNGTPAPLQQRRGRPAEVGTIMGTAACLFYNTEGPSIDGWVTWTLTI